MDEWLGNALLVLAGIIFTGIVSLLTTRLTSSTQKKTAEIESTGPNWQAFMNEVREQNEATKSELNGKIDRLQDKVSRLEDGMRNLQNKYRKAMVRLAAWHRKHPDDPLVDSLPEDLIPDMPNEYGV